MSYVFADYRKAAGFSTQEQLAALLDVQRAAIAKWETGRAYPQVSMLPKLAEILNISEGEIIAAIAAAKQGGS